MREAGREGMWRMRRKGGSSGNGARVGANGRRGGCGAQHSVHTNSTVSKGRGSPPPDKWRGRREGELVREAEREEGMEMDGGPEDEWRVEKCRREEGYTVRGGRKNSCQQVGQAEGEMKGTRTSKVMEREKRMEEGDREVL